MPIRVPQLLSLINVSRDVDGTDAIVFFSFAIKYETLDKVLQFFQPMESGVAGNLQAPRDDGRWEGARGGGKLG